MNDETIIMEMLGFGCASCVYTIEKTGRKIPGVKRISASLANQSVEIVHNGDRAEIVKKISEIVQRIGHEVREITDSAPSHP
ncbi:MAG: cation transporter [Kiritimatiellia bacterium]